MKNPKEIILNMTEGFKNEAQRTYYDRSQVYEMAVDKLDMINPNDDALMDIATDKLDLEYDEDKELFFQPNS